MSEITSIRTNWSTKRLLQYIQNFIQVKYDQNYTEDEILVKALKVLAKEENVQIPSMVHDAIQEKKVLEGAV